MAAASAAVEVADRAGVAGTGTTTDTVKSGKEVADTMALH
jgi:hypothetical protein